METTYYSIAESPVGSLTLRWSGDALVGVSFGDASKHALREKWIRDDAPLAAVRAQLDEYFRGERSSFDLPLAYAGTCLQERV
jgi:methylated-DNA-[protein]-cysteine S-methyltransferase